MKILKSIRDKQYQFRVIKAVRWCPVKEGERPPCRTVDPGEVIEIEDMNDQVALCQSGRVVPADLPEKAVYIALREFRLPSQTEEFRASTLEQVELLAKDALPLMLDGAIIPANDDQWRPFNKRLSSGKREIEFLNLSGNRTPSPQGIPESLADRLAAEQIKKAFGKKTNWVLNK